MENDNPGAVTETAAQESQKKPAPDHVGRDATLLTFSKVATSGIAMVITMLLSRFRTLDEYGTYKQILMVVNLVTAILMLGLPKSLNYFLARAETNEERKKFLSFYYTLNTVLSAVVGLALILSVGLIENYFENPTIRGFLYFLAIFPWTKIICASIENLLIVYKRAKSLVAFRILNSLALLLTVMLVKWASLSFRDYMVIYVAVEAAFAISVYVIAARLAGGIRPYISAKMLKTVLVFSVPLGLAQVVGTLNIELDKLLIGKLMDTEQFAIYSNAANELPVTLIASSFTAVLLPQMVRLMKRGRNKDALKLWGNTTILSMIVIVFIGVGCFVYARDVISVLYGEKYLDGKWVFRLYSLYLLFRCTYYGMVLNSIGKTHFIFLCSIGTLASNAVLNIAISMLFKYVPVFHPLYDAMIAPAIATFISTIAMALLQLIATAKQMKVGLRDVFPWKEASIVVGINLAFGAVFFFIKKWIPLENAFDIRFTVFNKAVHLDGSVIESIILALIWAAVYFAVMRKTLKKKWSSLKVSET